MFLQAKAQTQECNGSLGHWLFREDFGSGTGIGQPLAPGITNLTYVAGCPGDSQYTIANNQTDCFTDAWHKVLHDHTGNANGYMMVINASSEPNAFYTKPVSLLCPNTSYELSAYALNLLKYGIAGNNVHQPKLLFSIETTDGKVLDTLSTGEIPPTPTPQWNRYSIYFKTPASVSNLVLKISNIAPGGVGNDLLIDDIEFLTHAPKLTIPTAFSPNGDGINDAWNVTNLADYTDCVLNIYNRYGHRVFKSIGYANPWNGTDNGKTLATGTYYYVLDLKNDEKPLSGWILLVK